MNQVLRDKIREALSSVLPINFIILLLSVTVCPMPLDLVVLFLIGTVLLIVGTGLFSLGADSAMSPLGEAVGAQLTKTRRLPVICAVTFLIGGLITMAEPDLQVLAGQIPSIPSPLLIGTVALGVGVFFVLAVLRALLRVPLSALLIGLYGLVFLLSAFVDNEFVSMAFDSGGITTGPVTVPFIMAFGVGLASVRGDSGSQEDSFGLVALCSVGPILAVEVLGICFPGGAASYAALSVPSLEDTRQLAALFLFSSPRYVREVLSAVAPIALFCALFQLAFRCLSGHQTRKIAVGFGYTFVGLTVFLTGVNVGFMPAGYFLGEALAAPDRRWLLVPLAMVIGWFIVSAEPAVHVLTRQVEGITNGGVSRRAMRLSLSIGVAVSLGLSMVRVLTGISVYYLLIPGYALALGLTFLVPRVFVGIAFDSGGVASGPLTSTFLLPFAIGACLRTGGNVLTDAFGVVAMVAMTPLITIQALGLVYRLKAHAAPAVDGADDIVELEVAAYV